MKENFINSQFLYDLTNTGHYELHQFIRRVIEMCKDELPSIAFMWNIYDILLRQEDYYYKWKNNVSTQEANAAHNKENLLINYQLAYIRQKVDNVLLNILQLIHTPVEANTTSQTEETNKAIIDLINSYLTKAEWEQHAPDKLPSVIYVIP
jgi:hypothetical protein